MPTNDEAAWALYLGIYASVVSTATGLWALFHGIFRDRARVRVKAVEAHHVAVKGEPRPIIIRGWDTLLTMEITPTQRTPVLEIEVRNRGRRDVQIETVSKARLGGAWIFGDLLPQLPFDVPAERKHSVLLGQRGGYDHGSIKLGRFYVVDGAGRVHPLHERWRQRLEWPVTKLVAWYRRRRTAKKARRST